MIDWSRVSELREAVGVDGFDEVIELFLEEVEDGIATLKTVEPETMEQQLHFLKGSALNLGFTHFSALCQAGEKAAAAGHAARVEIAPILESYTASRAEFITEMDERLAG